MLCMLALAVIAPPQASGDERSLFDPGHPVSKLTSTSATLEYATQGPCETRVEIREGIMPRIAWKQKPDGTVRVIAADSTKSTRHIITLSSLTPGKRYYYRVYDPTTTPVQKDKDWGASGAFRREYSFSTLAPKGKKTIIRLPVKVLLMPNVINVESSMVNPNNPAPLPPRITQKEIEKIKSEFALSARFFWVNSGMRLWVDYQFFVDDRWQRWGPEAQTADPFFRGWPECRSYAGKDFSGPGGGDFTIVDTKHVSKTLKEPVVEPFPYAHQIEMAWPRRWNQRAQAWEFYSSGGGTYGLDDFPRGTPGRSQFLAGSDSAWLPTHELHHQLESSGSFFLADREDERIVFNHPAPRKRTLKGDQTYDENAWTTTGRHGEHWDVMAFWDRKLSPIQWLRCMFGKTEVVTDTDGDGVPDADPRLPLDEKRFGSDPKKASTDGEMSDLKKVMLSTWAPGPLQTSWVRPANNGLLMPNPKKADSTGLGIPDSLNPNPLVAFRSNIPFSSVVVDGEGGDWANIPVAGKIQQGPLTVTFKHCHDEFAYYGSFEITGSWKNIHAVFDGEGLGVYSGVGVVGFDLINSAITSAGAGPRAGAIEIKPSFGSITPVRWRSKSAENSRLIEFSYPNGGEGTWFWKGGGREIGVNVSISDEAGRAFALWQPYSLFWCKMDEPIGKIPLPAAPPQIVALLPKQTTYRPGNAKVKLSPDWKISDGAWTHAGADSAIYIDGLALKDFDLVAEMQGSSDLVAGAYTRAQKLAVDDGFVAFAGGYGNRVARLRFLGNEVGDEPAKIMPGKHTIRWSRREGGWWFFLDGKLLGFSRDVAPRAILDRVAVFGGWGGNQKVTALTVALP